MFSLECIAIDNEVNTVFILIFTTDLSVILQVIQDCEFPFFVIFALTQVNVIVRRNIRDAINAVITAQRNNIEFKLFVGAVFTLFQVVE